MKLLLNSVHIIASVLCSDWNDYWSCLADVYAVSAAVSAALCNCHQSAALDHLCKAEYSDPVL